MTVSEEAAYEDNLLIEKKIAEQKSLLD